MPGERVRDAGAEQHARGPLGGEQQTGEDVLHRQLGVDEPEAGDAVPLQFSGQVRPAGQALARADADADRQVQMPPV